MGKQAAGDIVLRDSNGVEFGSWSHLREIEQRSDRYLHEYEWYGFWTNWPKLHYAVDTSYLLGLIKAQNAEIRRLRGVPL